MKNTQKTVIVIGGGMAGIKACHKLKQNGISVQLLEISDNLGGRIKHIDFDGQIVEEGAQWVEGLINEETGEENPIWTLAKNANLKFQKHVDSDIKVLNSSDNGNDITEEYKQKKEIFIDMNKKLNQQLVQQDFKIENDLNANIFLKNQGWNVQSEKVENLVEWMECDMHSGEELYKQSTFYTIKEQQEVMFGFGNDKVYVQDQRGFSVILKDMIDFIQPQGDQNQNIFLSHKVLEIDYSNDRVKITALDMKSQTESVFYGDAVVCTVSIGVLQNKIINFVPQLPDQKQEAINQLKMGIFQKTYLSFKTQFWPDDIQFFLTVCEKKGFYPLLRGLENDLGKHHFVCFNIGDEARRIEQLQDIEQLKDEIQDHLFNSFKTIFSQNLDQNGACIKNVFRPDKVHVCKWDSDPRFYGSYSQWPAGAFKDIEFEHLICPLNGQENLKNSENQRKPVLFFAGEAYAKKGAGYIQGAFISGEETADLIIQSF